MCHRLLKFVKHTGCGHNAFIGATNIDCHSETCFLSSTHPPACHSSLKPCVCRRYYCQPERQIADQVPGKCTQCLQ